MRTTCAANPISLDLIISGEKEKSWSSICRSILYLPFVSCRLISYVFSPTPCSQMLAVTLLSQQRENDNKCCTASIINRHLQTNDTYLLPIIPYLYLHFIAKLHLLSRITYFNFSLDLYFTRRAHTPHTTHHTPHTTHHTPHTTPHLRTPTTFGIRVGFYTVTNQSVKVVEASWNVMAHAQKPDFFFRWNGRVHLNRRGRQFSRLLAAGVCASAVVMLDTPCSEVVWRVLATHSICQFLLHFPFRASPCVITYQLKSTTPAKA
jgi:hypothetical protein